MRGARGDADAAIVPALEDTPAERSRRWTWARHLKRVFEVDPRLRLRSGVVMNFVAVNQDFSVADEILARPLADGAGPTCSDSGGDDELPRRR